MKQTAAASKAQRVARVLEAEIRSGALHRGAVLSSEHALVERFSVSRTTVRKGLGILAAKGLIHTRVGIGSFVTYDGAVIDSGMGWSLSLSDSDAWLDTRLLRIARLEMDLAPPAPAGDMLAVDRIRVREGTDEGLTLERARVPWREAFGAVLEAGLEGGSLSRTLAAHGLFPATGQEWANVLPALSEADAALMGRSPGEPMLRLRRLTRDAGGAVVEYVESVLDPLLFGLHMEF
jgi:GntR family transcriptional regulator